MNFRYSGLRRSRLYKINKPDSWRRLQGFRGASVWPLIVSDDFASAHGGTLRSLGLNQLRGLDLPHELFAPPAV
jgi:hypothetical protein